MSIELDKEFDAIKAQQSNNIAVGNLHVDEKTKLFSITNITDHWTEWRIVTYNQRRLFNQVKTSKDEEPSIELDTEFDAIIKQQCSKIAAGNLDVDEKTKLFSITKVTERFFTDWRIVTYNQRRLFNQVKTSEDKESSSKDCTVKPYDPTKRHSHQSHGFNANYLNHEDCCEGDQDDYKENYHLNHCTVLEDVPFVLNTVRDLVAVVYRKIKDCDKDIKPEEKDVRKQTDEIIREIKKASRVIEDQNREILERLIKIKPPKNQESDYSVIKSEVQEVIDELEYKISQLERLQRDTLQSIENIKNIDEPAKAINDINRKLEQLATKKDIENLPKIPSDLLRKGDIPPYPEIPMNLATKDDIKNIHMRYTET
jgi:hypothetical protein